MKLNKSTAGMIAAAGLTVIAATGAMAQSAAPAPAQLTFASATGTGSPAAQSVVFTYTGGANGQFITTPGALFSTTSYPSSDPSATLSFTGFSASAPVTGAGVAGDPYEQALGGGTFSLVGSNGADLLDGTFTGGNLLSVISTGSTASITNSVNGVTYTGGSDFISSGLYNPGSFSISMTSVSPAPTVTNGYLDAFKAGGTSTFSASTVPPAGPPAVPEPATVVPFLLGGLGLLALAVRKTRRSSVSA